MLPRKLHLEQVNRFHDRFDKLDKEISELKEQVDEQGIEDMEHPLKAKLYERLKQYVEMTRLWVIFDDAAEQMKDKLDSLDERL